MKQKYLKAKHWQVFIIIFILPYSLQFIAMAITKNDRELMANFSPFVILVFLLGLFGWFWSIATGLRGKVPDGVKLKLRKFKVLLIIPLIYMPVAFKLFDLFFDQMMQDNASSIGMFAIFFAIMAPLQILSVFGFLYTIYFVAKTYKTVELQREVPFSVFNTEFFLFLIFPIGVWILQPRINKFVQE